MHFDPLTSSGLPTEFHQTPVASLNAGRLQVRCFRWNDRICHVIGMAIEDRFDVVMTSVEGTNEEAWPPSPPMQQIVAESIHANGTPVLLGVGLSGTGHWSAAIETGEPERLVFDIACKNGKPSQWLGSTYRIASGFDIDKHITDNSNPKLTIRSQSMPNMALEIAIKIGKREPALHQNGTWVIVPTTAPSQTQTHRWCFSIAVLS